MLPPPIRTLGDELRSSSRRQPTVWMRAKRYPNRKKTTPGLRRHRAKVPPILCKAAAFSLPVPTMETRNEPVRIMAQLGVFQRALCARVGGAESNDSRTAR